MKKHSTVKEFRYDIGYEMLMLMERYGELPLANSFLLAQKIQEYYKKEGVQKLVKDAGYSWKPNIKYWEQNIRNITAFMADFYKIYFGFLRSDGIKGEWCFMNKGEYEKYLKYNHKDISTRVDTQNERITMGEKRWQIDIPKINELPLLT